MPEVNATLAEEIYANLHILSLFQNNKSYPVIPMWYYAIKYFNEFLQVVENWEVISLLRFSRESNGYQVRRKIRAFQYLGGVEMNLTNSRFKMTLVFSFMGLLRFS